MRKFNRAAVAVSIMCAIVMAFGTASASADPPLPRGQRSTFVDHYTQAPDGSTLTNTTDLQGNPIFQPFATTPVPFDWTIDYTSTLRARDMSSSNGNFCERYRSDYVQNYSATPYSTITLIKNRSGLPDDVLESHRFYNDGALHSFCWPHHDASATYHFQFALPNFGYRVTAHGTAYRG